MIKSLEAIKQSVSDFPLIVPDLEKYLRNKCDHFNAGCVSKFIDNWQEITSDREILTTARGATIEFDATPFCMTQSAVSFSSEETDIINHEIAIV